MRRLLGAVALALVLSGCSSVATPLPSFPASTNAPASSDSAPKLGARAPTCDPATSPREVTIARVVDGDTVVLKECGATVRILGINTPETKDPRKPVECGGPEASAWAAQQLPVGAKVRLSRDANAASVDIYKRVLRYISYKPPGTSKFQDYSLTAVTAGMAFNYVYGKKLTRQAEFAQAEQGARTAKVGLWGHCPV